MTIRITFPIGRLVGGSVSKLNPKLNDDGTQRIGKNNKPLNQINFGVAIKKGSEQSWKTTVWGEKIVNLAKSEFPGSYTSTFFSWKIIDGDSSIPNNMGKIPNMQQGYSGNWVVWFSQGWVPKMVRSDTKQAIDGEQFKLGSYIQVIGDIVGNGATGNKKPGVFMNPVAVGLSGLGDPIIADSDMNFGGDLPDEAKPLPEPIMPKVPTKSVIVPISTGLLEMDMGIPYGSDIDRSESYRSEVIEIDCDPFDTPKESIKVVPSSKFMDVVAQPVVAQPVIAQPVVAQPVIAQPVVAQPVIAQPIVAQQIVAQQIVAQPIVAQQIVAQQIVAQQIVANTTRSRFVRGK